MDLARRISRRFTTLNKGFVADVEPVKVHTDGHGAYLIRAQHGKRWLVQQLYVNVPEARCLSAGRDNPNIDSQLRL